MKFGPLILLGNFRLILVCGSRGPPFKPVCRYHLYPLIRLHIRKDAQAKMAKGAACCMDVPFIRGAVWTRRGAGGWMSAVISPIILTKLRQDMLKDHCYTGQFFAM